jgi:transposase
MKKLNAQDYVGSRVSAESDEAGLPVVRRGAAGIDLGSEEHWVCAPKAEGAGREVAKFGATTPELERMAAWLKVRKVETVAIESTGVYWIAPHEVLERHGFEVVLVNTRELARVPGRKKTDRVDCKWIQRLHSCGLLTGSFRPNEAVCMLRTLVRDKGTLVAEAGDWLRRMQKSLDQMNVRVLTTGAGAWSALSRIRCAFRCASGPRSPTSTE